MLSIMSILASMLDEGCAAVSPGAASRVLVASNLEKCEVWLAAPLMRGAESAGESATLIKPLVMARCRRLASASMEYTRLGAGRCSWQRANNTGRTQFGAAESFMMRTVVHVDDSGLSSPPDRGE